MDARMSPSPAGDAVLGPDRALHLKRPRGLNQTHRRERLPRARLNETPPREWPWRARFSETTSGTPSQPIWPAAGQRGEGGPDLVRRDRSVTPMSTTGGLEMRIAMSVWPLADPLLDWEVLT